MQKNSFLFFSVVSRKILTPNFWHTRLLHNVLEQSLLLFFSRTRGRSVAGSLVRHHLPPAVLPDHVRPPPPPPPPLHRRGAGAGGEELRRDPGLHVVRGQKLHGVLFGTHPEKSPFTFFPFQTVPPSPRSCWRNSGKLSH